MGVRNAYIASRTLSRSGDLSELISFDSMNECRVVVVVIVQVRNRTHRGWMLLLLLRRKQERKFE